jgi:chorismate synthase
MFRYLTAGESHGKGLTLIIDGLPAGVSIDLDQINRELARRQQGYGRGDRQKIENDQALVFSGLRFGETIGAPITLHIPNRDWKNHRRTMSTEPLSKGNTPVKEMTVPRPGHADLAGWYKYGRKDLRDIWEQSSARDTAVSTAAGAIARQVLEHFGVRVASHVIRVGKAAVEDPDAVTLEQAEAIPSRSKLRCADRILEKVMESQVDRAGNNGDTLGGAFQVLAGGIAPGLGKISHTGDGIDARMTSALMSVPSVKGVEIGYGVRGVLAGLSGKHFHDPILREAGHKAITRGSNRAGGIEGGLTNGELIRLTAYVKPISTLAKPLDSVDLQSGKKKPSESPRSDVCVLPSAAVVAEAAVLLTLLDFYLETFGGNTLEETVVAYQAHMKRIEERLPEAVAAVVPRQEPAPVPEPMAEPLAEPEPEVKPEPEPVLEAVPNPAVAASEPEPVAPAVELEPPASEAPPESAVKAKKPYFLPTIDPKPQN